MLRRHLLALALPVPPPSFTARLWAAIDPIFQATLRHPFLTGLQDGSLPRNKFQFYLTQDALYLSAFSRALLALAAKAPQPAWKSQFQNDAREAIQTERAMHSQILASYGISPQQINAAEMAPTNTAYTNHLLLACSQLSFPEGLAAMLPCYWIYWEVGKRLKAKGSPNPDYQRWINQYADPAYGQTVDRTLLTMNAAITPAFEKNATRLFTLSSRYEYQFWDMAWRLERWTP